MGGTGAFDPERDRMGQFSASRRPAADLSDVELPDRPEPARPTDPLARNRIPSDVFAQRYRGRGLDMAAPGRFDGMSVEVRCDPMRTGSPAAAVFAVDPADGDCIVLDDGRLSYDDVERLALARRGGTLAQLQSDMAELAARRISG